VQPDALAVDLDDVGVDHGGDSDDVGETCGRETQQRGRTAAKHDEAHSPYEDKKTHSRIDPLH
jgi:hypothetical protein